MFDAQAIAAIIASLGLGAGFAAAVTAVFQRRKVGAEATESITNAAVAVVEQIRAQMVAQGQEREQERHMHAADTSTLRQERDEARAEAAGLRVELGTARRRIAELEAART